MIALSLLLLTGCGLGHRHLKLLGPEQLAIRADPAPPGLLAGEIVSRDGTRTIEPLRMEARDGTAYLRPIVLTDRDTLVLGSRSEERVELDVYLRSNGLLDRHDFRRVDTVTGSLARRYPNEVVLLPDTLDAPVTLSVDDLDNVYNNYSFDHGDTLLVVARTPTGRARLLFKRRDAGFHVSFFGGVLATIPLRDDQRGVAPILAAGTTLGWRTRKTAGPLMLFDTTELVISAGVGSTALESLANDEDGLGEQVQGVFNAALVGGGVRLFKVVTIQGFVNTTQFFRDAREAPATLAIGVDAAGLAAATRDIFGRLIRENPLKSPPRER